MINFSIFSNAILASGSKRISLLVVGFFLLGLFVFTLGIALFLFWGRGSGDIEIISSDNSKPAQSLSEILVDVEGAVINPGLYKLAVDARVNDAVLAAGGLASDADRVKVNLAAKLVDGQKIFVPSESQQLTPRITSGQAIDNGQLTNNQGQGITSFVSINSATEGDLDTLPGVGPVTAQKIISGRPYGLLADLLSKKVVNKSTFEKIKDLISL